MPNKLLTVTELRDEIRTIVGRIAREEQLSQREATRLVKQAERWLCGLSSRPDRVYPR